MNTIKQQCHCTTKAEWVIFINMIVLCIFSLLHHTVLHEWSCFIVVLLTFNWKTHNRLWQLAPYSVAYWWKCELVCVDGRFPLQFIISYQLWVWHLYCLIMWIYNSYSILCSTLVLFYNKAAGFQFQSVRFIWAESDWNTEKHKAITRDGPIIANV